MICTTLCYLEREKKYLMLYRNKKKVDMNHGKWIGVGGHIEEGETPEACVQREVYEETGFTLKNFSLCAKLHFYIDEVYELCYLYISRDFVGELKECDEGELKWIPKDEILKLNLWQGDILFLKRLLKDESYFEMKLTYIKDDLKDWNYL